MKILHINCNYLSTTLHQNMVRRLNLVGVHNNVFVPIHNSSNQVIKPDDYVYVSHCFNKWDRIWFKRKQKKILKSLESTVSELDEFDCIHAYTLFTDGNCAWLLSRKYNIPYVVAIRNTDVNVFLKYMVHLRRQGVQILLDAKAVFFLSDTYEKLVFEKYIPSRYHNIIKKKSYLIPNGIDDFWHCNIFRERDYEAIKERIKQKELKIIFVGRIESNKNIYTTVSAIQMLIDIGWKIDFFIIGAIEDNNYYNKIKKYVKYIPPQSKESLISYYREADVFVMPSIHETFGLVYAEAMSQGLPVLYTRGQGFDNQFAEGEVGYSVCATKKKDIANKLIKITDNYQKISQMCLEKVKKFRWDFICEKYSQIYHNI